jgi:hypothetical protein
MAGYRAIRATCEAVTGCSEPLTFQVYTTGQFQARPVSTGVSLFLYNVSVNSAQRILSGRPRQLSLDLHLLLTPWATEASLQHEILGWTCGCSKIMPWCR